MEKNRRNFIKTASMASMGAAITGNVTAASGLKERKRPVCAFTKCLQFIDFERTGETLAFAGFDGADVPVRPGGSVLPENVEKDLPRAVKALKKNGISVPMIVSAIVDADDPLTERVLGTISNEGISYYRTGYLMYDPSKTIQQNLDGHKRTAEKLEKLNRKFGLHGAYQNHSGMRVGGPVWDLYWLVKDCDPNFLGIQYDFCHASAEGGVSWPLGMKLIAPWIKTVDIKDYIWAKAGEKWKEQCVPLGEGMVNFDDCLELYVLHNISGPFSLHFEYNLGGAESGKTKTDMILKDIALLMKRDCSWFTDKINERKIRV